MTEPCTELDSWLAVATRGLCAESRERVAEEVAEHFRSALREARASGLNAESAEAEAMRALGKSRRARRRFGREHLTQWEANCVARAADTKRSRRAVLLTFLLFVVAPFGLFILLNVPVYLSVISGETSVYSDATVIPVLLPIISVPFFVCFRWFQHAGVSGRLLIRGTTWGTAAIYFWWSTLQSVALAWGSGDPNQPLIRMHVVALLCTWFAVYPLYIRRRLNRTGYQIDSRPGASDP